MPVRAEIWRSFYLDSMILMRLASELSELPGVRQSAALMGTPANHELLASAGLAAPELADAGPGDLMLAADAETEADASAALAAAKAFVDRRRGQREASGRTLPRTLQSALRALPDANLATISVPGAYATMEATDALRRGLHVFLFSDNVSVEDEIALKRLAVRRRRLCMGPDCGTAYLGGVGLGFANVVPRGRIGCVAASGTGLQAVASRLAMLGEGISHGIGVGGRDLSDAVDGAMTKLALDLLAADPATEVVVLISKPPAPRVMNAIRDRLATIGKPAVVCCLGASPPTGAAGHWVSTLEDAATAAAALARGMPWSARAFTDPDAVRARLAARRRPVRTAAGAHRALHGRHARPRGATAARAAAGPDRGSADGGHRILDLGADEFTRGRPHPMIDPGARDARIRDTGGTGADHVLLVDVVLGRAVHPDPAASLAAAVRDARRAAAAGGRELAVVASVIGTDADPQGLRAQAATLENAGVHVLPSSAQAARFAALLIRPELAGHLLGADA